MRHGHGHGHGRQKDQATTLQMLSHGIFSWQFREGSIYTAGGSAKGPCLGARII
jgi:hypothetical protein